MAKDNEAQVKAMRCPCGMYSAYACFTECIYVLPPPTVGLLFVKGVLRKQGLTGGTVVNSAAAKSEIRADGAKGALRAKCVFCEIIASDTRPYVAEWSDAVAFVPLGPVVDGHVLVVPRRHVENATSDPDVTAATMRRAAELAQAPCNIITSAGAEATQSVFHLHVHIVPRAVGDGLKLPWTGKSRPDHPSLNPCRGRCEFHGKLWCEEYQRPCAEYVDA